MKPPSPAQLLTGVVIHRRLRPVAHRFAHPVFFLRLQLSALESARNPLFSLNRFNLLSLHFSDHGACDGTHPLTWIRGLLAAEGLHAADGEVWLQCFPRVLGYVFNPVSFWFCHGRDLSLRAIVAEVSNTFGERHHYLLAHPGGGPVAEGDELQVRKAFHVSPFLPVAGRYAFRFMNTDRLRMARIDYLDETGPLLHTSISGRPAPLTASAALRASITHPMMTFGVMARIHWHALRLWMKRVPFFPKPNPPSNSLSR